MTGSTRSSGRPGPGSIVMKAIEIGEGADVSTAGAVLIESPSIVQVMVTDAQAAIPSISDSPQAAYIFDTPEEGKAAEVTLDVIAAANAGWAASKRSVMPMFNARSRTRCVRLIRPAQGTLEGVITAPRIEKVVEAVATTVADRTISIPQIVVLPKRQVTFTFADFDLKNLETINVQPVDDGLVIQNLRTEARLYLAKAIDDPLEERPEDYLVRHLIERNEIDYDAHADLLCTLAGQLVERVRSYLDTDADVENVLLRHGRQLAEFIFAQMMQHYRETPLGADDYEVRITRGFTLLKAQPLHLTPGQRARNFRQPVSPLSDTKRQVFTGFSKCCYPAQKFHSDPERRFAVLIDGEAGVKKWLKPARDQFKIEHKFGDGYEPDFVVETSERMFICEVKAGSDIDDPVVISKAYAAIKWCEAANRHAAEANGKPGLMFLFRITRSTAAQAWLGLQPNSSGAHEKLPLKSESGLHVFKRLPPIPRRSFLRPRMRPAASASLALSNQSSRTVPGEPIRPHSRTSVHSPNRVGAMCRA